MTTAFSKVLVQEVVLVPYYPELGEKLGICASLFLQQLHYWITKSGHVHDGVRWCYNTHEQWAQHLKPYSSKSVQRAINTLVDLKLVKTGTFNKHKYDKTLWYTIDYEALTKWFEDNIPQWSLCLTANGHFVHSLADKLTKPIPENTQEIPTENPLLTQNPEPTITMKTPSVRASDIVKNESWKVKKDNDKAKSASKQGAVTATAMVEVWRSIVPTLETSAGCVPVFTQAQKGMLARVGKLLGHEATKILEYTLLNWVGYAKHTADMVGLYKVPHSPTIPFLAKYVNEAKAYYKLNAVQLTAPKVVSVAPVVPAAPLVTPGVKQSKIIIKKVVKPTKQDVQQQDVQQQAGEAQPDGESIASVEDIMKYVKL